MEREVLSSFPWDPVTGRLGTAQSCTTGGSDWTWGSISLARGWSNPGTGFLERWSMPLSVWKRHLDNALHHMLWLLGQPCSGQAVGRGGCCRYLPTGTILFYTCSQLQSSHSLIQKFINISLLYTSLKGDLRTCLIINHIIKQNYALSKFVTQCLPTTKGIGNVDELLLHYYCWRLRKLIHEIWPQIEKHSNCRNESPMNM